MLLYRKLATHFEDLKKHLNEQAIGFSGVQQAYRKIRDQTTVHVGGPENALGYEIGDRLSASTQFGQMKTVELVNKTQKLLDKIFENVGMPRNRGFQPHAPINTPMPKRLTPSQTTQRVAQSPNHLQGQAPVLQKSAPLTTYPDTPGKESRPSVKCTSKPCHNPAVRDTNAHSKYRQGDGKKDSPV